MNNIRIEDVEKTRLSIENVLYDNKSPKKLTKCGLDFMLSEVIKFTNVMLQEPKLKRVPRNNVLILVIEQICEKLLIVDTIDDSNRCIRLDKGDIDVRYKCCLSYEHVSINNASTPLRSLVDSLEMYRNESIFAGTFLYGFSHRRLYITLYLIRKAILIDNN